MYSEYGNKFDMDNSIGVAGVVGVFVVISVTEIVSVFVGKIFLKIFID